MKVGAIRNSVQPPALIAIGKLGLSEFLPTAGFFCFAFRLALGELEGLKGTGEEELEGLGLEGGVEGLEGLRGWSVQPLQPLQLRRIILIMGWQLIRNSAELFRASSPSLSHQTGGVGGAGGAGGWRGQPPK